MSEICLNNYKKSYKTRNKLIRFIWYYTNLIVFNSYLFPVNNLKVFILRKFGANISSGVVIKPKVNIKYPWNLTIGEYSWIGEKVWIDNLDFVEIESNVCISQGVYLLTGNHNYNSSTFDLQIKSIKICSGVWVAAKCIILPGAHLRKNTVVAAGVIFGGVSEEDTIYKLNQELVRSKRFIKQ